MPPELEDRLERAADALPAPSSDSRDRARGAALAALAPARRRGRRKVVLLAPAVAVAVAVAVAAVAVLAAPWRDNPLATERALAALGHEPVIHAIVQPSPRQTVVDLASGRERLEAPRSEYWYDDERDVLRVRLSVGGRLLPGAEYVHSPEGFFTDRGVQREQMRRPQLDPALEGFASGYREALDSGEATVVGEEVVDGREAVILRFPLPPGPSGERISEEVAVDADEYRPLRFRFSSTADPGRTIPWSEAPRIVEIETIPRDPRDFELPQVGEPRPAGQTGVEERRLSPAEAATALGRPVFWPGRAVEGVELAQIELMRLTTTWTDGRVTDGLALVFQYGVDRPPPLEDKPSLIITEGTATEATLRFDIGGSMPRSGELRLRGVGRAEDGDAEMWFGSMQRDGVYISFESPQRDLILAAARALVRLD
jgi:hypothetical protein